MTEEQIKHKAEQKYKEHLADPNYCENSEEESFYTGYVEGYLECQKANEWHYPSKGELPKEDTAEKETLYLLRYGLDDRDYMTGVFSHGRFWCFDSGWYETNEVIAWKEIVPPKE